MDEWNGCSLSSVNKPLKPTESKVIFAHIETDAYNTNTGIFLGGGKGGISPPLKMVLPPLNYASNSSMIKLIS